MSNEELIFKEQTASKNEIYAHLCDCDKNYEPPLNKRVNILEYSNKIFEKSVTFEAWANGSLIGLVAAYLNDVKGRTGYITDVSVKKNFMGRGIASVLMHMCLDKSKKTSIDVLNLEVFKDNTQAIKFYRKFGFQEFQDKGKSLLMRLSLAGKK